MSHWYKYKVDNSGEFLVCKTTNKSVVPDAVDLPVTFMGCVDKKKIDILKQDPWYSVYNDITSLKISFLMDRPTQLKSV